MIDQEERLTVWQCLAELEEQVSQVGQGLRFRIIRIEQPSQMMAKLLRIAVQDQIGQQRLQARLIQGGQWFSSGCHRKIPKEAHL